jgi:ribulose-phosphate 3-epimerase
MSSAPAACGAPKIAGVGWGEWVRGFEIEPSLYAADFLRLGEQIEALLAAGARVFHFDVGDGHFVPPVTIGPVVLRSIAPLVHGRGGVLDCHLMVDNPGRHFREIAESGGDSVTFHVEVAADAAELIAAARELGLGAGVACNPGTPVDRLADAAAEADLALCMSIEPGYSGQAFMPEALPRLERLRALLPDSVHVQVDGGIGADTVRAARAAGANLLVAGTAVFGADDIGAAYRDLAAAATSS